MRREGLRKGKDRGADMVVALAGNPNVGKSTLFNALTGSRQHTGNWPGKTVSNARGRFFGAERSYTLMDLPGCYSLLARSAEEECARDFLCLGAPDAAVVVCDAGCLERNLNLVLQTMELCPNVLVCVNLLDEAKKRGVTVDLPLLSRRLGVPVAGAVARRRGGLRDFVSALDSLPWRGAQSRRPVSYPEDIEKAVSMLEGAAAQAAGGLAEPRWLSLRLIEGDEALLTALRSRLGAGTVDGPAVSRALGEALGYLAGRGISRAAAREAIASAIVKAAEDVCRGAVTYAGEKYGGADRRLDRLFTSRAAGYPAMLALLAMVMWLTIVGANYPSELLARLFSRMGSVFSAGLSRMGAPPAVSGALVDGVWRVLAWVVSVMLPPMAIFFPLFTLLEDAGYLPRVAYNLDSCFRRCGACGKQSLTMAMGFGCNAAGVVGCRIIDSPRERLLAVLTNNFVPCNGRFPALIAMLAMFFSCSGAAGSLGSALLLTGVILIGVGATFLFTKLLSATVLRGVPSSFTLEMPPYRAPQVGRVIVRYIFDRTLFVLGRAAAVAAPAGLVIWCMANIRTSAGGTLLAVCSGFLDPAGRLMGLDGAALMAFILGFPANETVVPILLMTYMAGGSLAELGGLAEMRALLTANGWTWATAASFMLFSLMHWPCSTALITIRKETGSAKWTALAFLLPTAAGFAACALFTAAVRLLG